MPASGRQVGKVLGGRRPNLHRPPCDLCELASQVTDMHGNVFQPAEQLTAFLFPMIAACLWNR